MLKVSIVIVCMNNLKNLYPCLESIKKYTTVSYECFVVAYLFSKENLDKVKRDFPWVKFIESNEIRGFSENNNLALRQAKGKYCFVLNDDTEMKMPVVDRLVESIESLPENVAILSPNIVFPDGSPQCCGRPKRNFVSFCLSQFHINVEEHKKYTNKQGVFLTYNILGAAFLIKTSLFERIGFFDEVFFYCPEDIAVSTVLNRMGYKCFVDSNIKIIHYGGGTTWSKIMDATEPAAMKGALSFYSNGNTLKKIVVKLSIILSSFLYWLYYSMRRDKGNPLFYKVKARAKWHNIQCMFNNKSAKQTFIQYFKK